MKFLVVLALALAVCNGAFTGSLVRQTQPLLSQIKADISSGLSLRNSAEVGLKGAFTDAIQQHVQGILVQIEAHVDGLQAAAFQVATQIAAVVTQIQSATQGLGGSVQQVVATLTSSLQSLLASLVNGQARIGSDFELTTLIESISLQNSVEYAVISVFGEEAAQHVLSALAMSDRGFWGDIWGSITGGVSGLAGQIAGLATGVWHSAADKFNAIKNVVSNFVAGGWNAVQTIGFPAAQNLLHAIAPYFCDLGPIAARAVAALLTTYTGIPIPAALIQAAGGSVAALVAGNVQC